MSVGDDHEDQRSRKRKSRLVNDSWGFYHCGPFGPAFTFVFRPWSTRSEKIPATFSIAGICQMSK
jgi:hypothetical protein